jgi:hypothetical protein
MEMRKGFLNLVLILTLTSCSNTKDMETGEIETLKMFKQAFDKLENPKVFVDARNLLSRQQVDAANIPVLFVELASGQNGTLVPYPGQGVGQTWLGADGATITMERGVLKASRGVGDDIMGSSTSMPPWSAINTDVNSYNRKVSHLTGNNKIRTRILECKIQKSNTKETKEIWDVKFLVTKFEESCSQNDFEIKNTYYVDNQGVVRKSSQYLSDTLGSILIERLDR